MTLPMSNRQFDSVILLMEIKHCNKCGKDKPISEFGKNKSRKDGLQTMCKKCIVLCANCHRGVHYQMNKDLQI